MSLILPNGMNVKKTETLLEREMAWLAMASDVCQKLGITIACRRCLGSGVRHGSVLQGANDPSDPELSVTCQCRRMVFQKA